MTLRQQANTRADHSGDVASRYDRPIESTHDMCSTANQQLLYDSLSHTACAAALQALNHFWVGHRPTWQLSACGMLDAAQAC